MKGLEKFLIDFCSVRNMQLKRVNGLLRLRLIKMFGPLKRIE